MPFVGCLGIERETFQMNSIVGESARISDYLNLESTREVGALDKARAVDLLLRSFEVRVRAPAREELVL